MTSDSLSAPFLRLPIMQGLSARHIERIALAAERVVFQPGDVIQRQGEIADAAVLILSGKAVVVGDDTQLWQVHGEPVVGGSLVGELAMLIEAQTASTVIARSSVRAFRIPRAAMRALMETDPSIADHFVAKLSERLSRMAAEMRRIDRIIDSSFVFATDASGSVAHQPQVH